MKFKTKKIKKKTLSNFKNTNIKSLITKKKIIFYFQKVKKNLNS